MPKLPNINSHPSFVVIGMISALFIASLGYMYLLNSKVEDRLQAVTELSQNFRQNYNEKLFEDHIKVQESLKLQAELNSTQAMLNDLLAKGDNEQYQQLLQLNSEYNLYLANLKKNTDVGLDVGEGGLDMQKIAQDLLNKNYSVVLADVSAKNEILKTQYSEYLALLPPPPSASAGEGYSYTTVSTERGSFGVYLIKVPLSSVTVVTASAYGDSCKDNCATKSLAQHIQDNDGFAGINGSYFCPPDYANCSGKINSTDFAFYHSGGGKWLQKDALSWGDTGLATFNGRSARFYKKSSSYDGDSVTAGISNYPTLLDDGNVVIDEGKLSSYQKDAKGPRGAIGVGKENLYLAIVSNATVIDAAYAMRALGALDALNLDGGGSSAMYINGGYVVGPGRSLPNAVVLKR